MSLFGNTNTGGGLFGASNTQQQQSGTGGLFGSTQNQGTTNPLQAQPTQPSLFGGGTSTNTGSSIFGAANTNNTTAGTTGGGLFGGGQTGQTGGGGLFGNTNTTQQQGTTGGGLFGQQQQQSAAGGTGTGLFGGTNTQPATGGTGLFGSSTTGTGTTGGLFGNNTNQPAAGTTGTGGLFGSTTTQNQPTTSGLFGNTNQTQQTGTTGLFGSTTNQQTGTTGGLFGNTTQGTSNMGGLFGNNNQQQQGTTGGGLFGSTTGTMGTGTGLFGGPKPTGSLFGGTTTGGGLFGGQQQQQQQQQQQPTGGGLFGNTTQQQPQAGGLFGSTNQQPAAGGLFGNTNQQRPGGLGASTLGVSALGTPGTMLTSRSGAASYQRQEDPATQLAKIHQQIENIYISWNPQHPECRFQHPFYNLVEPSQVNLYGRPPNALNNAVWEKAVKENPDPSCLVPVIAIGFDDLRERLEAQSRQAEAHQQKIKDLKTRIENLKTQHAVSNASRLQRAHAQQVQLMQRLVAFVQHLHILIPAIRSSSIRPEEEELRRELEKIELDVKKGRVKGKLNELWALLGAVNASMERRGSGAGWEWAVVDEEGLAQISQVLGEQQMGLAHLTKILTKDLKDLAVITGNHAISPEELQGDPDLWTSTSTLRASALR